MFKVQFQEEHRTLVIKLAGKALVEVQENDISKGIYGPQAIVNDDRLKAVYEATGLCKRGIAVQSMKGFEPDEPRITITFDSVEDAKRFKDWLCNQGEQDFYEFEKMAGVLVCTTFEYHDPGGCDIKAGRE